MIETLNLFSTIADCVLAIMAVLAGAVSFYEYKSNQKKENNKLFSQLNKRYINNTDIQAVVKYLRDIDPENVKPRPYQTELFLRFFEELGVYLREKNIPPKDVKNFFGYYLDKIFEKERGRELLKEIRLEKKDWPYLKVYMDAVGFKVPKNNNGKE